MRVVVFTATYHPEINGITNYIDSLHRELKKLGVETVICCPDKNQYLNVPRKSEFEIVQIPCWRLLNGLFPIAKPWATSKVMKHLAQQKPDIVITHTRFFSTSLMGARFAKKNNIRHVHVEHGNTHVPHSNPFVRVVALIWDQTIGRYIFKKADQVVVISKKGVDFTKKLGAKNPIYIPNGINLKKYSPGKSDFRKLHDIGETRKLVSYCGRLVKEKGVQDLIDATSKMDIDVVIAGAGPYRKQLEKQAEQSAANIHFIGEVNSERIVELLRTTDLFVNPSYAEGLPTSVLEAAATEVPIIATDVGGTNQIPGISLYEPRNIKQLRNLIASSNKKPDVNKIENLFSFSVISKKFKKLLDDMLVIR